MIQGAGGGIDRPPTLPVFRALPPLQSAIQKGVTPEC